MSVLPFDFGILERLGAVGETGGGVTIAVVLMFVVAMVLDFNFYKIKTT
jgi:hypothetical protein